MHGRNAYNILAGRQKLDGRIILQEVLGRTNFPI
jgi:hypothetical protein